MQTGLVLEGGGMRGVFTSGVLDSFMKYELEFPYVVAVSAGACNGLSYMSHQIRRARMSNIDLLKKYDYLSIRNLLKTGCIFDPELLYEKLPNDLLPYDYEAYFNNPSVFEMVTTNCLTGRACYIQETKSAKRLIEVCQASSSLPYVSKTVEIDGVPMLDGGLADSIPVMRAFECGVEHPVVVLTRNRGYRHTGKDRKQPAFIYKNYPRLRVLLSNRLSAYNSQLEMVERLEDEGRITVLRPQKEMTVGRMEKDVDKLEALYEEGFLIGEKYCKNLTTAR